MFHFYKYQGTGNDFVIVDGITQPDIIDMKVEQRALVCDRKFGIGADGLIILVRSEVADFKMLYYNSDGRESTMCGNGGRCISKFAFTQGYVGDNMTFEAIDGLHASIIGPDASVSLEMQDVDEIKKVREGVYELDTGSPHYVYFDSDGEMDIVEYGKSIRYSDEYKADGINVNIVQMKGNGIKVQTYERGVEDETLSCGTGVTACALSAALYVESMHQRSELDIYTKGGNLRVKFEKKDAQSFTHIYLCGPAEEVFSGYYH